MYESVCARPTSLEQQHMRRRMAVIVVTVTVLVIASFGLLARALLAPMSADAAAETSLEGVSPAGEDLPFSDEFLAGSRVTHAGSSRSSSPFDPAGAQSESLLPAVSGPPSLLLNPGDGGIHVGASSLGTGTWRLDGTPVTTAGFRAPTDAGWVVDMGSASSHGIAGAAMGGGPVGRLGGSTTSPVRPLRQAPPFAAPVAADLFTGKPVTEVPPGGLSPKTSVGVAPGSGTPGPATSGDKALDQPFASPNPPAQSPAAPEAAVNTDPSVPAPVAPPTQQSAEAPPAARDILPSAAGGPPGDADRLLPVTVREGETLAPGASPGIMAVGDFLLDGGLLEIEIWGLGAGIEFDVLMVDGIATFDSGTIAFVFTDDDGVAFVPEVGNTFDFLFAGGGIVGFDDNPDLYTVGLGLDATLDFLVHNLGDRLTLEIIAAASATHATEAPASTVSLASPAPFGLLALGTTLLAFRRAGRGR